VHIDALDEREVKLAVPLGFVLPALRDAASGVSVLDRGDAVLDAVYWDTDDLQLASVGVGLRHRNGTWTFKGRTRRDGHAVVREELEVEGGLGSFPAKIRSRLDDTVDLASLRPVARLHTVRRTLDVARDGQTVEVVHDRVRVRDGDGEVYRFEEVEVEHDASSADLAAALVALLVSHGAAPDATAKYVRALRALGHEPPALGL